MFNIRAARPISRSPVSRIWNHFFGFQLRLQNWTPFQSPKIHPKSPKKLRKPSPRPLQNGSKTILILQTPKIKKNATLPYENLIFDVHRPSKIVPKSMQKRLQNQLYVGYPLGTLKNTIFDVKTSPRWTTKISDFFQKSSKNSSYYGLWSKMPLGGLQEPPKSLPRAVQEPSRGVQEPSRSSMQPPKSRCVLDLFIKIPKRNDWYQ